MDINSMSFNDNSPIPKKYTCDGENINPDLYFENIPKETKSLVLIVTDPDAPNGTFTHWVLANIDPTTERIKENSTLENAVKGKNDFGNLDYGGPCPPSGMHRYFFRLYALNTTLDVNEGVTSTELEEMMMEKIIDTAELMGIYSR